MKYAANKTSIRSRLFPNTGGVLESSQQEFLPFQVSISPQLITLQPHRQPESDRVSWFTHYKMVLKRREEVYVGGESTGISFHEQYHST